MVARLVRLRETGRRRGADAWFVEGVRFLCAAVDSGAPIRVVVHSPRLLRSTVGQVLVRRLIRRGMPEVRVTPEEFRAMSTTRHASGVGCVLDVAWTPLERLEPRVTPCWIALSDVRNRGNLGTLLRTAEAVGASGLIALGESVDPFDPDCARGSMGAVFWQPVARSSHAGLRAWADATGTRIVGAAPDAGRRYDDGCLAGRTVLMLGEEGHGLTHRDRAICDALVHLPMIGHVDSLNLGVAASILLYEGFRAVTRTTTPGVD